MFDEEAGIMEDHRRELAYFEKDDLKPSTRVRDQGHHDGDDQVQGCHHPVPSHSFP